MLTPLYLCVCLSPEHRVSKNNFPLKIWLWSNMLPPLSHSLKCTICKPFTAMTAIMVLTLQGDLVNSFSYYHYGFLMKDHLCAAKIYYRSLCIFFCFVCTVNAWTYLCNAGLIQSIRCRLVWMALNLEYISVNNGCMRGWGVGYRISLVVGGREGWEMISRRDVP